MNSDQKFTRLLDIERIGPDRNVARLASPPALATPVQRDDIDLDLAGLFHALWRRRRWIAGSIVLALSVALLVSVFMKRQYVATSRLQLLNQEMGSLSLAEPGSDSGLDGVESYSTLQTYVTVLQSEKLGMQLIHELRLMDIPEFQYSPLLKSNTAKKHMAEPFENSSLKRAVALNLLHSHLSVEAVPGTRVLTISYTDTDPALAAAIVNRLVSDFVEYNYQVRRNATTKGMELLSQQLVTLKADLERYQARAVALQKASGVFGMDEQHNIIVDRLDQLNTQLIDAQQNRIAKEVVYKLAQGGNPELVASLLGNPSKPDTKSSSSQGTSMLIDLLRQQESQMDVEYADAASKYGPAYPRMVEIRERRAAVRNSIESELKHVLERAKSEYELATAQEDAARRLFDEQRAISGRMNGQLIDYMAAKSEADDSRQLYDHLLQKLNEAGVLAGLHSSELNILDSAEVPGTPSKPQPRRYLEIAGIAGLVIGLLLAWTVEALDRTARATEDIESKTRLPLLGVVPVAEQRSTMRDAIWHGSGPQTGLPVTEDLQVSEAFSALRNRLLLSSRYRPMKVLMVASAVQGDGKSFTSLNLAKALCQNGRNVLLVDADLRLGRLSQTLKEHGSPGLGDALCGVHPVDCYRSVPAIHGLTFMPAGNMHGNRPAEMFESHRMSTLIQLWSKEFTQIVIDTPPLLAVSDAVVLTPLADGVILVARYGYTDIRSLERAARLLSDVNGRCIGVLVNAMDMKSEEYLRYTGPGDNARRYAEALVLNGGVQTGQDGGIA